MAEAKIINKVIDRMNDSTLLDLTPDTVNENNLLLNETAHNNEGEPVEGEINVITDYDELNGLPKINNITITGEKTGAEYGLIDATEKGVANGIATLNSSGQIPSTQLPAYVDDVQEGYRNPVDGLFYEESTYETLIEGESGIIYVDLLTENTYRWSGSVFIEISKSLNLGETENTAYAGNKGKANADAIQAIQEEESLHPKQPIILSSALSIGGQTRTTVETALSALNEYKQNAEAGKGLSTEDYTTSEKTKLNGIDYMTGATDVTPGVGGLVPTPAPGDNTKVLYGNGRWETPIGMAVDMVGATSSTNGAHGLVPQPLAGEQDYYLKGDGTWSPVSGGGGSGGHTILDESGTELPQRSKLQFEGCEVTDDSTNDITKIKAEGGEVISYADYQQLTPQQQANGDYFIPDYPDTPTGFDETPTIGSTNPVTSNGIATELNAIKTFIGVELESATKLVGDTSVTFTDSVIKTTSGIHLKSENASDTPIFRNPAITRSNGSVTFTFPPLTENTKFYLEVRNYEA